MESIRTKFTATANMYARTARISFLHAKTIFDTMQPSKSVIGLSMSTALARRTTCGKESKKIFAKAKFDS